MTNKKSIEIIKEIQKDIKGLGYGRVSDSALFQAIKAVEAQEECYEGRKKEESMEKFKIGEEVVVTRAKGSVLAGRYKPGDKAVYRGEGEFRMFDGQMQVDTGMTCFGKLSEVDIYKPTTVIEKYVVTLHSRQTTISFENDVFKECRYGISGMYTYNDWMFLGKVADTIKRIKEKKRS